MPNDVKLQEGHPVDENLRPIKVGGKTTALEVSEKDVRVNNLYVNGTTTGVSASDDTKLPLTGGAMTGAITTDSTFDGRDVATDGTKLDGVEASADVTDATNVTSAGALMDSEVTNLAEVKAFDTSDYATSAQGTLATNALPKGGGTMTGDITTDSDIISTNLTIDDSGDITLDAAGGDVNILQADLIIPATKKLYFDGDGDTYITESGADIVQFYVGNDKMIEMTEAGTDGNLAHFDTACVGFTRKLAIFSATAVIASGGTDDTDIDFRFSNKYRLEMTGDITTMNLIFPAASGNFLLVCTTNGDHDVTNWKVFESDESAATVTDVMWAGGSVPAFTSSGVDIVSFYWDANEQEAYGVASLAFATP